ncbi:N-acetyltransferase family protein [Microbacterium sp. 179-B 1A2 NHS]|uniref:GNAT family N-acetyltransferase n=1 Tax=Microbacterium sp. 179-B 1A2 NHS TaxID=3142383 RepID=UPI0039A00D64
MADHPEPFPRPNAPPDPSSGSLDQLVLRQAREADAAAIARLIRQAKAEAMPWLKVVHTLDEDVVWVAEVLMPRSEVRVAQLDDRIVGFIATRPGWVEQLYVAPTAQGRGVGSALLLEHLRTAPGSLQLWTFQRNSRARAFYERHGFSPVRETDGDNEEAEPDVLYRRDGRRR